MPLKTIFRGLVIGQWLIAFVGTPAIYTLFFTADATREVTTLPSWWWLLSIFGLIISVAAVAASIGLWRFRRWGRTLFVAIEIVSLGFSFLTPLFGWAKFAPATPLPTTPLDWLIGPMTGAIIALAFASPIAAEFSRDRPSIGQR